MREKHIREWLDSQVDRGLLESNPIESIAGNEVYERLLWFCNPERRASGRLTDKELSRLEQVAEGGWWFSTYDPVAKRRNDFGCFKPDNPRWLDGKPLKYESPRGSKPKLLFFEHIPQDIWEKIAERAFKQIGEADNFYQWLHDHPEVPLDITEGAKKVGALLSAGFAACGVAGITHLYQRDSEGKRLLHPQLEYFCNGSRTIRFVVDCDDDRKTRKEVSKIVSRAAGLIKSYNPSVKVLRVTWNGAKGCDDFIRYNGIALFNSQMRRARPVTVIAPDYEKQKSYSSGGGEDYDFFEENQWPVPVKRNGELGIWRRMRTGEERFIPLCNFDLKVVRELVSEDGGSLELLITRSDGRKKVVTIANTDCVSVTDFEKALLKGFGTQLTCNLGRTEVKALLHARREEYRKDGGIQYRLAPCYGRQIDGTWVFRDIQFTALGEVTTAEESGWIFDPNLGEDGQDVIPSPEVKPPDDQALPELYRQAVRFLGVSRKGEILHQMGYGAAVVHLPEIVAIERRFPLKNLYGDAGTRKTILDEIVLSMHGMRDGGMLSGMTESALFETLKFLSGVYICLDDPQRSLNIEELLKRLYNLKPRKVRGNYQRPLTTCGVNSNHAAGDSQPATLTRLIRYGALHSHDGDSSAWDLLQEAQRKASGGFSSLIKLGYHKERVRELSAIFRTNLNRAHERVADSLALVTHYAMSIAELVGEDPTIAWDYTTQVLIEEANASSSNKPSLHDFLERLAVLRHLSEVGTWNVRVVESSALAEKALAVHMKSVWEKIECQKDTPIYSRSVVEGQIKAAGGVLFTRAKFHESKIKVESYERGLIADTAPKVPPLKTAGCHLIPVPYVRDVLGSEECFLDSQS